MGIVFFAALALAAVLVVAILLGIIKPNIKTTNYASPSHANKLESFMHQNSRNLPNEIGRPALGRELFANSPKERWGYQDIEIEQKKIRVPFPDFHWWQLLDPKNAEVLEGLKQEMKTKWEKYFINSRVYAASSAAFYLLRELDPWLSKIGAEARIPDPNDQVEPAERVIVFDIYTTTGQALVRGQRNFPKNENKPTHYLVLIYNDLMPIHEGPLSGEASGQKFECLFFAGDYVKFWPHQSQDVLDALSVIRNGFREITGWDWNSDRAREAVSKLQSVLHSPDSE